jgi:hypothetical protein
MAYESTAFLGSGVSALREPQVGNVRTMRGTNNVVVNYEDVNSCLGIIQNSGLTVAAAAVQLNGPATRLRGRRHVMIQNLGAGNAFIGGSGVTTSNGVRIASGEILRTDILDFGDVWIVSASTSDVRVLELR